MSPSAPDRRLRVGVIGPGEHARRDLLPSLRLIDGMHVVAISSRNLDKARTLAEKYSAPLFYSDWRSLASSDNVDMVVVAGPPDLHYEVAMHCLKRNIHVFVDKPPAQTSAQLAELIACERDSEAVGFVGFNFPYSTSYAHFLKTLRLSGALARLHVRFVSKQPREAVWACRDLRESVLLSSGTHAIDLLVRALGTPHEVIAREVKLREPLYGLQLYLGFPAGVSGSVELGTFSNRFEFRIEGVNESGGAGVLEQLNRMSFSGLTAPTVVAEGAEVMSYEWPCRRGGYDRTGYEPMLRSHRDSIFTRAASTSRFAACAPTYWVIEEALAQLRSRA